MTGFVFHPTVPSVKYIRTDIGGTYGYDSGNDEWYSLADHVTMADLAETYPIAIALDPDDRDRIYIACGTFDSEHGVFAVSHDRGLSFMYYELPVRVHGNLGGRGTGCRLIVDVSDPDTLYFASQTGGLLVTHDGGETWSRNDSFAEDYMTLVGQSTDGSLLFAGCAGVTTRRTERLRGHSLYVSADGGNTFEELEGPEDEEIDGVAFAGHVAQRITADDKYIYVTFAVMGRNAYIHELGYSCDGGAVIGGRVYRYSVEELKAGGRAGTDITPGTDPDSGTFREYGFGGISAGRMKDGLLIVSTICHGDGDCIYRSYDHGDTWECVLHGLSVGKMEFDTPYMKPEHNGGRNLIHWLTDLKLDPCDEHKAWFNTGTGVFRTEDITADTVTFHDACRGIEETVHLNVYAPPAGDTLLIDILGDLGGFAFTDLDTPCDNSFADEKGNRYITCINADYSDEDPLTVVVTPRGNWTGETRGGLILSHDGCRTFERISLPYGLSGDLDRAFRDIERPNVNSGWAAISRDTRTIVWTVADGIRLPVSRVIVTHDGGQSFAISEVTDLSGAPVTEGYLKVFADRDDSRYFYGFARGSRFFISRDSGDSFVQIPTPENFPYVDFGLIDCADPTEVRGDSGNPGAFYAALGKEGMWKLTFDPAGMRLHVYRLTEPGDSVFRLGLGVGKPGGDYFAEPKAVYFAGIIGGRYGFFRTEDDCISFTCINSDYQMFGDINSVEGDPRVYGRYYIATGSRGLLYGVPDSDE